MMETAPLAFTSAALRVLDRAPDKLAVMKEYTKRLRPSSWSGSLAEIMEANVKALASLEPCTDQALEHFPI